MKSYDKPLRIAYDNCLNDITYGGEAVPFVDGFSLADGLSTHHIIYSDVNGSNANTLDTFISAPVVTLQIVSLTDGYTKDVVDDIEGEILSRLIPTINTNGLEVEGFQVTTVEKQGHNYIEEYSEGKATVRKIIRISQRLIEQ